MAKKTNNKESVVDYLKSGERTVDKDWSDEDKTFVKIRTATGLYTFYEYTDPVKKMDAYKEIENYRKREDRRLANKMNYGDERGRSAVFCDNRTALDLALLKDRPDYLRVAYRAYLMTQKAKKEVRQYVYHNLIVRANIFHKDAEKFLLKEIDPYTFEVLPPAWRKCMNDPCPELEGVTLTDIMEELTPAWRKGQRMARQMRGGRFVLCEVVGYEINYKYGYRSTLNECNPYALEYRVKTVGDDGEYSPVYSVKRDNAYPAFHAEKDNKK